jgi:hypothetical protein
VRATTSGLPPYGIWVVLGFVVVFMLGWFALGARRRRATGVAAATSSLPPSGPWEAVATRAVARASARLVGQRYAGLAISSVFHYGAVDIGTQHLVVWVLVSGPQSEELPGWWSPGAAADRPLPQGWEGWLTSVRDLVREELAREAWPDAASASVLFDSEERVGRTGFDYFR